MKFIYKPDVHDEDDVIECLLSEMITPAYAGGCLQVPGYLHINSYDYDRFMEPTVREKMYEHGVAKQCTGEGQSETAIMITPKGIKVAKEGGWKAYLNKVREEAEARKREQLSKEELTREAIRSQGKPIIQGNNNVYNSGTINARDLNLGEGHLSDLTAQSNRKIPEQKPKAKSFTWDKVADLAKIIAGLGALGALAKFIIESIRK